MYVVIGGFGDASRHLGKLLAGEGNEVAIVDNDVSAVSEAKELDALVVRGDICDPKSLKDADISRANYYVGIAKEDSTNLASCSLANYHGCGTIARIKSPDLSGEAVSRRYAHIGVDFALCPSLITSSQISRVLAFPSKLKNIRSKGIDIYHFVVEERSPCMGKALSNFTLPLGSRIISIFRGVEQILPYDSMVLQAEDEVCILLDSRARLEDVENVLGVRISPYGEVKDVFIAGASRMGLTTAQKLLEADISVVLMDVSKDRTREAAEKLPSASVIYSNPLGHGILKKEEIMRFDVLMAMEYGMERNILISVLGKQLGIPKALALIDRIDFKESVERTLVDDVVVPNLLLVKTISNLLKGSEPLRKKSLHSEEIKVQEFKLKGKMRCVGKTVGEFSPASGVFQIIGIVKGKKGFIPDEGYRLSEDEKLFLLYHPSDLKTVNRWLVG
jgi:trk system potassium uptake protein TrkA